MQNTNHLQDRLSEAPQSIKGELPEIAIIVPTFNERDNIVPLLAKVDHALSSLSWEVVFVDDDSADGTGSVLRDVCRGDARVRMLRRIGRRFLPSAVVEAS